MKWLLVGLSVLMVGCAHPRLNRDFLVNPQTQQVVLVTPIKDKKQACILEFWQKEQLSWERTMRVGCMWGRSGVIDASLKKEGDGHTPAGTYSLTQGFGYYPFSLTEFSYSIVTEHDLWVDDPKSPDYNQWVKAPTSAQSFERLRREDHQYQLAVVIDYNRDPVVPYKGSAIFLHIWRRYNHPTAGCVAVSQRHLRRMMSQLRIEHEPVIIIEQN